jgi:hypothetical protein
MRAHETRHALRSALEGYARLEQFAGRAPQHPHQTPAAVVEQVVAPRRQQPTRGTQRPADEVARANGWAPLAGPNTFKRILRTAGPRPTPAAPAKWAGPSGQHRTTDDPGQIFNVVVATG